MIFFEDHQGHLEGHLRTQGWDHVVISSDLRNFDTHHLATLRWTVPGHR